MVRLTRWSSPATAVGLLIAAVVLCIATLAIAHSSVRRNLVANLPAETLGFAFGALLTYVIVDRFTRGQWDGVRRVALGEISWKLLLLQGTWWATYLTCLSETGEQVPADRNSLLPHNQLATLRERAANVFGSSDRNWPRIQREVERLVRVVAEIERYASFLGPVADPSLLAKILVFGRRVSECSDMVQQAALLPDETPASRAAYVARTVVPLFAELVDLLEHPLIARRIDYGMGPDPKVKH